MGGGKGGGVDEEEEVGPPVLPVEGGVEERVEEGVGES